MDLMTLYKNNLDRQIFCTQVKIMQTHQKLVQISCVRRDLFQKVGYLCYSLNGSRTIPFPLVSQSFGKPMGIVGDCEAPIPHAGCRCGGGLAHTPGTEG